MAGTWKCGGCKWGGAEAEGMQVVVVPVVRVQELRATATEADSDDAGGKAMKTWTDFIDWIVTGCEGKAIPVELRKAIVCCMSGKARAEFPPEGLNFIPFGDRAWDYVSLTSMALWRSQYHVWPIVDTKPIMGGPKFLIVVKQPEPAEGEAKPDKAQFLIQPCWDLLAHGPRPKHLGEHLMKGMDFDDIAWHYLFKSLFLPGKDVTDESFVNATIAKAAGLLD